MDEWHSLGSHLVNGSAIDNIKKRLDKFVDGEDRRCQVCRTYRV